VSYVNYAGGKISTLFSYILYFCLYNTHTHTYNHFTALLEYVRDHLGEQVPERVKPGRLKPIWIYWSKR